MFKFKGISSTDMQVVIEEEEHFIARAAKRYETIEIEGRDGAIFNELGYSYVERPIYVQCLNTNKIDEILAWLDGEGEFEYKGRKTTARFYTILEPKREACIKIIDTTFIRDPFWNKANEEYQTVKESKIKTATGNPIYINDSTNLEAKLRLNGGSKQETREGSNLLNFNVEQNSKVTVNADGTLTINGTGGFNLNIEEITLKTGITYYQKWQLVSGSITGVTDPFLSVLGSGGYITQNAFLQATTTEDVNKNTIWVHTSAVFENAVVKIWANTDQSDFEQYGVMPSPNYPSNVETVGSNINLFDKDNANILTKLYIDNANMKIATTSENTNMIIFSCEKNKDYTISRGAGTQFRIATTTDMPANNVAINNTLANHTGTEISITTGENDNYIVIYIGTNDLTDVLNS